MPSVNIAGQNYHYIVNRQAANTDGQKIVYIHGTGCNGGVFERHIHALSDHQAAALDLSGHGRSDGRGFRGVVDHAYCVAEFISALNWQPCIVAGHSMGGGIAIALAIYFPEVVKGLILIDTGARLRVAPAVIEFAKRSANGITSKPDSRQGFSAKTDQALVDELRAITAEEDPAVTLKDWYADDSCDFMGRLANIDKPSLAICGRDDQLTPLKYHEYLRDHMPDCELQVIEDAAHWPFVEQPLVFDNKIRGFLERFD